MEAALDIRKAAKWIGAKFSMLGSSLLEILIGAVAIWLVFLRGKTGVLDRPASGRSDNLLSRARHLHPLPGGERLVLFFRNLHPRPGVNDLHNNLVAQVEARQPAKIASLKNPILPTTECNGFESLNNACNHLALSIARAPLPHEQWLFAITSDDRKLTRKECICCFLETFDRAEPR